MYQKHAPDSHAQFQRPDLATGPLVPSAAATSEPRTPGRFWGPLKAFFSPPKALLAVKLLFFGSENALFRQNAVSNN